MSSNTLFFSIIASIVLDSLAGSNSSTSVPPQNGTPGIQAYTSVKQPATVDYLTQLLKDKKQLAAFPNVFLHLERLVDDGKYFRHCSPLPGRSHKVFRALFLQEYKIRCTFFTIIFSFDQ